MNEVRVVRAARKAWQLGPRQTMKVLAARLYTGWYEKQQRARAMAGTAHHTWTQIASTHQYSQSFTNFFAQLRTLSIDPSHFLPTTISADQLQGDAHDAANQCIDLLGSGKRCFSNFPWHDDFKAAQYVVNEASFGLAYYKDIKITATDGWQLGKDIKVPWELSRFQHLFPLAMQYRVTNDQEYAVAFERQVTDWLDKNPFLRGPNWVCPMDVALRAVNWICAFAVFKNTPAISAIFWERLVCSLYDHLVYLENNWEIYDSRTSNHYFSDLVGYLYLTLFFRPLDAGMNDKAVWCWQEIGREIDKQFGADGTDYEGSTGYHRLMTELVYHAFYAARMGGFAVTARQRELFERMCTFLSWCAINKDEIIMIGDYDSGKVLFYGLPPHLYQHHTVSGKKVYPNFGISFLKTDTVHLSLRHHVYRPEQPSGHFHNDAGSMTLAIRGIPIIVDPGSYCYTPSAPRRNHFRSTQAHSTVMVDDQEQVPLDNRLFALDLPDGKMSELSDDDTTLMTMHELFKGAKVYRKLQLRPDTIEIADWWEPTNGDQSTSKKLTWTFMLHPGVRAEINDRIVQIYQKDKLLLTLESDLEFQMMEAFYAPAYGVKKDTCKLVATKMCSANESSKIIARIAKK